MKIKLSRCLLSACLIFMSIFPVTALALDEGGWTYEVGDNGEAIITMYSGADREVTIPKQLGGHVVTAIGSDAFTTVEITSVTIHKGVTSIEPGAFWECRKLGSIDIDSENPNYMSSDGIVFSKDGTVLFHYPAAKDGTSYTVADTVTTIGRCAFDHNQNLNSIVLPDTVTEIGEAAFWRCQSLADITIPKSVTSLGEPAFANCSSLTDFVVAPDSQSFKTIDGVLFDITGTRLLQFPAGRTGSYTVPEGVTAIGPGSFRGCIKLKEVIISDSVTDIGSAAFAYCDEGIESIILGSGIKTIGGAAFQGCFALTSMIIPASVTDIEGMAFDSCEKLNALYFMGKPPALADNTFQNTAAELSIYYHYSREDALSGFSGYKAVPFCVVTFDSLGGSAVREKAVGVGCNVEPPASPEYPGFAFVGWYTDAECTDAWDFAADTAAEDVTLYAKWAEVLKLASSDDDGNIKTGEVITLTPSSDGGEWDYDKALLSRSGNTFTAIKAGKAAVKYTVDGQASEYSIMIEEAAPVPTTEADTPVSAPAEQSFPWIIVTACGVVVIIVVIAIFLKKRKRSSAE